VHVPNLFIEYYALKTCGSVAIKIDVFLISALVGREWSTSRPYRFTPGQIAPDTHCLGGRMGPRFGLNTMEKIKFLTLPGVEFQPVASPYTDCDILAPKLMIP
jgi:hypothetical protein